MRAFRPHATMTGNGRRIFALLLLLVTLFVQSTALASENREHHDDAGHCCLVCHVFQSSVEASAPTAIAPLVCMRLLGADPHSEFLPDVFRPTCSSRGPPTLS